MSLPPLWRSGGLRHNLLVAVPWWITGCIGFVRLDWTTWMMDAIQYAPNPGFAKMAINLNTVWACIAGVAVFDGRFTAKNLAGVILSTGGTALCTIGTSGGATPPTMTPYQRQLVRQAEQLVVEGHKFAAGGGAAKDAVLHELFQAYDTNNNGALEKGEVRKLLKHLCRPHESEEEVSWEDSADSAKQQLKRHATLKKIAKDELQQCMQEMEGITGGLDRRHRKIDFIAFKKWWQKRLKDRKQA